MVVSKSIQPPARRSGARQGHPAPPQPSESRLAFFGNSRHDKIDIHLKDGEYQGIDDMHAARMMGYFTQQMQNQGFPWEVHDCDADSEGTGYTRKKAISEMDALARLKSGQPVLLQPKRNLQLDLSSNSLGALAAAGSLGGTDLTTITRVAAFSKASQIAPGSQGIEIKYGEPLVVSSYGELKLLYQMYNPDEKIKSEGTIGKAAHQLSYFTQKTATSAYPWRFYKKAEGNTAWRVTKALVKRGLTGALIGGGLGLVVGGPIGLFAGSWDIVKATASIGAGFGGLYSAQDGARTAAKGEAINAVEGLERILNNEEVVFQETQMRSVGVPIMGKVSWFSDHGEGSPIDAPEKLDTFYWMQNQDAKLPEKKEEPKKEEPKPEPPRIIVVDNRSYHHHLAEETHLHRGGDSHEHLGDEIHEHPIIVAR